MASFAHSQAGQKTQVSKLLPAPGGMLIKSFGIWPAVTACRCSQRAPMCQESTNGVASTTGQAWRTNSWKLLRAVLRRSSSSAACRRMLLSSGNDACEFVIAQLL